MAEQTQPLETLLEEQYPSFWKALQENGFNVKEAVGVKLAPVDPEGPMYCGDGRKVGEGAKAEKAKRAPKIFGGTLGIATLIAHKSGRVEITQNDVLEAKKIIEKAGYTAGIHDLSGHDSWDKVHCGFAGLIGKGELGFGFADEVTIDWVVNTLGEDNQVMLKGEHGEVKTIVNLGRSDRTIEPDGSSFGLDPWVLRKMRFENQDIDWLLELSVGTVVKLGGPREIEIIR